MAVADYPNRVTNVFISKRLESFFLTQAIETKTSSLLKVTGKSTRTKRQTRCQISSILISGNLTIFETTSRWVSRGRPANSRKGQIQIKKWYQKGVGLAGYFCLFRFTRYPISTWNWCGKSCPVAARTEKKLHACEIKVPIWEPFKRM